MLALVTSSPLCSFWPPQKTPWGVCMDYFYDKRPWWKCLSGTNSCERKTKIQCNFFL